MAKQTQQTQQQIVEQCARLLNRIPQAEEREQVIECIMEPAWRAYDAVGPSHDHEEFAVWVGYARCYH